MKIKRARYYICAVVVIALSWDAGQAWGGGQRREDKKHRRAWARFAADLSRGDCSMDSLSEEATVTLPIGQVVSKEEYRLACSGSMGDATVGRTSVVTDQLMTIDKANFSVEATIVTEGIAAKLFSPGFGFDSVTNKTQVLLDVGSVDPGPMTAMPDYFSGNKREVSYPAAFFLTVDSRTDQVTAVRMYAQNIALLAARGYSMVPDDKNAPVIRPA